MGYDGPLSASGLAAPVILSRTFPFLARYPTTVLRDHCVHGPRGWSRFRDLLGRLPEARFLPGAVDCLLLLPCWICSVFILTSIFAYSPHIPYPHRAFAFRLLHT